jgi:hypothetical protein
MRQYAMVEIRDNYYFARRRQETWRRDAVVHE